MPQHTAPASWADFLKRYQEGAGTGEFREYAARETLVFGESVVLVETVGRVDLVALAGLRVGAGAVLTIDNPNLVVVGPPPAITVKAGGTLKLVRFRELMLEALPPGGILIEAGGRIELGPGVLLPSSLLDDRNSPVVTPKPEPARA